MKRFCTKFYIAFALFASLYLTFVICKAFLYTGDLGALGAVPFGPSAKGTHIGEKDSLIYYQYVTSKQEFDASDIIVIGDSFSSSMGDDGFPNFLGRSLGCIVKIASRSDIYFHPVNDFIGLVNTGFFYPGQTVVLETVERECVKRLLEMDINHKSDEFFFKGLPQTERQRTLLSDFIGWMRLKLPKFDNPVKSCKLSRDVFTHSRYSDKLFYYVVDLFFEKQSDEDYLNAVNNLSLLYEFAEGKGINLIFLIAADKYGCYEPWIIDAHSKNPASEYFKDIPYVFDSKGILQEAVSAGEKDVYMVSNTHWSNIGAGIVGEALADIINDNI